MLAVGGTQSRSVDPGAIHSQNRGGGVEWETVEGNKRGRGEGSGVEESSTGLRGGERDGEARRECDMLTSHVSTITTVAPIRDFSAYTCTAKTQLK